jgi:threonine/homoserine/homoserine lactone efflux protein
MSEFTHHLTTLATIALVYLAAVASPGPNFFLATQLALSGRRSLGFRVALGIAAGSAIWATLAMLGVAAILAHAAWLRVAIRVAASLYLAWFGIKLIRGALRAGESGGRLGRLPETGAQAFRAGLATNMTNPKAAAFWTSIFGAMFPADAPFWMYPATVVLIVTICGGWYVGVAMLLSTERVQRGYDRIRRPVDAVLGMILLGLGAHLATSR